MNKPAEGSRVVKPVDVADKDLEGSWYHILHNIHGSKCTGGEDSFSLRGGTLMLTKYCTSNEGKQTGTVLSTRRRVTGSKEGDFIVTSGKTNLRYMIFYLGGEKDERSMIVGNGDGKSFIILSRKSKLEVCALSVLEQKASSFGFDITDVIRERGRLVSCAPPKEGKK